MVDQARVTLTTREYVDAAVAFIDTHGLGAFTMRSLGEVLGVDATAMYRHFANKDALMTAVLDAVLEEVLAECPATIEDPRQWLWDSSLALRRVFERHPNLAGAIMSGTGDLPHLQMGSERMLEALEKWGLRGADLVHCFRALEGFVLGAVIFDLLGAPSHYEVRQMRHRRLAHPAFDEVTRSIDDVREFSQAGFECGLNAVLDRCEQLARGGPG